MPDAVAQEPMRENVSAGGPRKTGVARHKEGAGGPRVSFARATFSVGSIVSNAGSGGSSATWNTGAKVLEVASRAASPA